MERIQLYGPEKHVHCVQSHTIKTRPLRFNFLFVVLQVIKNNQVYIYQYITDACKRMVFQTQLY